MADAGSNNGGHPQVANRPFGPKFWQVLPVPINSRRCASTNLEGRDGVSHQRLLGYSATLTPALLHLARDPEVEPALVITDGDITYPTDPMPYMPYQLLWVLTTPPDDYFKPNYGHIMYMPKT